MQDYSGLISVKGGAGAISFKSGESLLYTVRGFPPRDAYANQGDGPLVWTGGRAFRPPHRPSVPAEGQAARQAL
eukprot:1789505-Prymnesium_polylepis.1